MTSATENALISAIANDIASSEEVAGEVVVMSFVVIATFLGEGGDHLIYSNTMPGQRSHETLGLVSFGLARENARAAGNIDVNEEDDE
jgi:hypothetical protein